MKKILEIFLSILTAMGGFVEIGELVFSVNAGLEASMVTPGSTAPDASLTVPVIDAPPAWANASTGASRSRNARVTRDFADTRMLTSSPSSLWERGEMGASQGLEILTECDRERVVFENAGATRVPDRRRSESGRSMGQPWLAVNDYCVRLISETDHNGDDLSVF